MRRSKESVDGVLTSRCSRTGDARAYPVWIVRAGEGAQKNFDPLVAELEKPPDGDSEYSGKVSCRWLKRRVG